MAGSGNAQSKGVSYVEDNCGGTDNFVAAVATGRLCDELFLFMLLLVIAVIIVLVGIIQEQKPI